VSSSADDAIGTDNRLLRLPRSGAQLAPPRRSIRTCLLARQYESYLRREDINAAILTLAGQGIAIKDIVRRTGHSRNLIRQVIRGERTDVFRIRQGSFGGYLPLLDALWSSGCCRNGAHFGDA
jgi:hypothetical protein